MHTEIKKLADDALALQNKDRMDAALREISALCDQAAEQPKRPAKKTPEQPLADAGVTAAPEGGAK